MKTAPHGQALAVSPVVAFTPLICTPAPAWQALVNLDEPSFSENRRVCSLVTSLSDQAQFEQSLYLLWAIRGRMLTRLAMLETLRNRVDGRASSEHIRLQ